MMTVSIQVEPDTGIAIGTCFGVLGLDDVREAAQALWKTPSWPGKSAVWDFRETQFDLSASDIRQFAQFVLRHQPPTPPLKIGFVTDRDVDFGIARMFEVFREDPRTEFRVFRDYDAAVSWARSLESVKEPG